MPNSFDYAVVRVVPRVEREEFLNVGVVVFCAEQNYLGSMLQVDEKRLAAFAPHVDLDLVRTRLNGLAAVVSGEPSAGPIAKLSTRERFHWVVSPKSTIVQTSPVHSGLCENPAFTLDHLFHQLCASPAESLRGQ